MRYTLADRLIDLVVVPSTKLGAKVRIQLFKILVIVIFSLLSDIVVPADFNHVFVFCCGMVTGHILGVLWAVTK